MKITRQELDPSILLKLDQFDNITQGYNDGSEGVISYNKGTGFYFKKTNDTFLKRVFTEDEIIDLEESLRKERKNVKSSLLEDIRVEKKYNNATKNFLIDIPFSFTREFSSSILLKEKLQPAGLLFLLSNGELVRIIKEDIKKIDLVGLLKKTFNISSSFSPFSFVDMCEIDENNFIVATTDFGIYKVSMLDNSVELICMLNLVKDIEYTHTGNLFVATDEFCAQYDIKSGNRIEKYNNLVNERHIPKKIIKTNVGIFVLAIPAGIQNNDNLLHFWKLDSGKVGYNCCDAAVPPHSFDNAYQVMETWADDTNLYLSGKLGNHKLFIWKYSLDLSQSEEIIIDCLDITTFDGFLSINNNYVFLCGDKLFIVKDNSIIVTMKLKEKCKGLYIHKGQVFTTFKNNFAKFLIPEFETKADVLSYQVYKGAEPCNNIDIFVKDAGRAERISIINGDSGKEILPSFYMIYENNTIIKLINSDLTNIKMLVNVNENTNLGGIVIKTNRLFLRK